MGAPIRSLLSDRLMPFYEREKGGEGQGTGRAGRAHAGTGEHKP